METATGRKETHGFQTEISRLLDLMIHSLYSNREIFLRELVSNASDAADRLRFDALADESLYEGDGELKVWVSLDAEARTITVRDNGIGMDREEVVENLGTIAKSGTAQFLDALTGDRAEDTRLIGQFGVGFYSSFIVADRVTVTSRRAGADPATGVRWESAGEGEFTIEGVEAPRRGTEVVLHLREDADEFLEATRLRTIVRKYSDHVSLPVVMRGEGEDAEDETVNAATALWTRTRSEIEDDEYREFYRHVSHDFDDPLAWTHNRVEGSLEYTSLLYVPSRAPFDLWDRSVRRGVRLYVRRVFILDDADQLMPPYLRFVRGVVDTPDLPLNISREMLQGNRQIESIRSASVKRVLDLLAGLAKNDAEKYAKFWSQFGRVLKEGMIEDSRHRDAIAGLLRFASTRGSDEAEDVSLADYVGRMSEGQDKIYYITADSRRAALGSPHLEIFRAKGVEVLLLTDDVDEWVVHHLDEFEGKHLQSVTKGELDLDEDDAESESGEAKDESHAELLDAFKTALGERVKDVRVTGRLIESPVCLVADDHEMGRHLEKILEASGQKFDASKPILEINAEHPMVARFAAEADEARRRDWAAILFNQALLSEGGRLADPADFVRRLNSLLVELAAGAPPPAAKKKRARKKRAAAKPRPDEAGAEPEDAG